MFEEILLTITTTFATVDYTLLLEVIGLPGHAASLTVNVSHTYGAFAALWFLCLKTLLAITTTFATVDRPVEPSNKDTQTSALASGPS